MEDKTTAVRREVLKYIIDGYVNRGKKVMVLKAKEKGVYKNYVSDDEVWDNIKKFATYHNLPVSEDEIIIDKEEVNKEMKIKEVVVEKKDEFLIKLEKEHRALSKKLLALNKVIEAYKELNS